MGGGDNWAKTPNNSILGALSLKSCPNPKLLGGCSIIPPNLGAQSPRIMLKKVLVGQKMALQVFLSTIILFMVLKLSFEVSRPKSRVCDEDC